MRLLPHLLFCFALFAGLKLSAQPLNHKGPFTRQDTLRGSNTPEREWWDVVHYELSVEPDYKTKTITGSNRIYFEAASAGRDKRMQLDLQAPMEIDSVVFRGKRISKIKKDGNVWYVDFGDAEFTSYTVAVKPYKETNCLEVYFHGKPREAIRPPWDGGWIWKKDRKGRPWMTVACQGLGASVWYPCKDYQGDEPEQGATLELTVPDTLAAVANGLLAAKDKLPGNKMRYRWRVKNPINTYNLVPYIGVYSHFGDEYEGEKGKLNIDQWVLDYNLEKAKKHFSRDVKPMLKAFEYWFGPYPFYQDGFKLVESPHLGMEHQSAIAYGNNYMNGYMGGDLSGSGWGLKWDYIIIHEAGHEWFGNNITTRDIADMWVHEGFTMYSEVLFIEYHYGKTAGDEYLQGIRRNIRNDIPLIGPYGVNQEGSGDMYNKGASLIHTIRQVINNDSLFRAILRGLNKDYYHRIVTSRDVELYFSKKSGKDLSRIFDQYLRTVMIPQLEYSHKDNQLRYRWTQCVEGFAMPVRMNNGVWLYPTTEWKTMEMEGSGIAVEKNFYVAVKKVE